MKFKSEFVVTKWDEEKCTEPVNSMLISRASIVYTATGAISGTFDVEYLLHYTNYNAEDQHNAVATYTGYLTFSGSIDGKSGSFVLEDKGSYSPAGPISELTIKPNTGTGDFADITGVGRYFAEGEKMIIELDILK